MPHDITGQNALVTGASSGIGAAAALHLAKAGCNLILTARRADRLKEVADQIQQTCKVKVHCMTLDAMNFDAVAKTHEQIPDSFKPVHILVNNAGLASGVAPGHEVDMLDVHKMIDTNVKGVVAMTKAIVPHMVENNYGHVLNVGSIAGQEAYPKGAIYCASKHAMHAFTNALRHDLVATQVRVTVIAPGAVETEFSVVRYAGDTDKAKQVYKGIEPLVAEDIAEDIVYAATRPPRVQCCEITTMPTLQSGVQNIARVLDEKH